MVVSIDAHTENYLKSVLGLSRQVVFIPALCYSAHFMYRFSLV